jgi:hypothetical protein
MKQIVLYTVLLCIWLAVYNFYPSSTTIVLAALAIVIFALLISGKIKLAWGILKYILLGVFIRLVLYIAHFEFMPWGLVMLALGMATLIYLDK